MNKYIKRLMLLAAGVLFMTGCGTDTDNGDTNGTDQGGSGETVNISFATSGQGGTFYVAGSGMAGYVNSNVDGIQMNAEVTQGVVENLRLMSSGQTEMGFSYGSTAYNMLNDLAEFEGQQYEGIRGVASIHAGALNFVTLDNTGIETVEDLVGKIVSIGPQGSGSAAVSEEFLRSAGLWDDINIRNLGFDDSASSLRDGHIDAFIIGGTTPVPSLIELEATHPMKLLELSQEQIDTFLENHPYHIAYTISADGYSSLDADVETVGYSVIWVADESVEDWIIHDILEGLFSEDGQAYLKNVQAAFTEMAPGLEHFEQLGLPVHPGAEQYYNENE